MFRPALVGTIGEIDLNNSYRKYNPQAYLADTTNVAGVGTCKERIMAVAPSADRRRHARHPLPTSVRFSHEPSRREFPGRCVDISKGGMLMYVPASAPVKPGDSICLTLASVSRPEFANMGDGPVEASVVRADRKAMLSIGNIIVGLRFLDS